MSRVLVHRPGFTQDLLRFDGASIKQVLDKCTMLLDSPQEEGKGKARLDGRTDGLHRLRSGDFRVFYTFDDEKVSLWGVRRKTVKGQYRGKKGGDVTYDGLDDVEDDELDLGIPSTASPTRTFDEWVRPVDAATSLPEPMTVEVLAALSVPPAFHARLLEVTDQDALLACPGVPEEYLLAIDRHMFEEPIDLRGGQPELVAPGGVDDLLRFTEGKVVGFLLKLNPEQEKFVTWATSAGGPTLVKGGPGTGKSTVAIYRAREMVRVLRESGVENPTILFTTYTNALVTFSKQLLESLLGEDATCMDVRTADSLVGSILGKAGESSARPNASQRETCRSTALDSVEPSGNVLQRSAQERTIARLGRSYLFEEIETVIQGRGLHTVEQYLAANRPGRRVPLNEGQRRAVWVLHHAYERALIEAGFQTWQQGRARAAEIAAVHGPHVPRYDAVIVDEAQDLDTGAVRMLVEVCEAPNRLFITADESQSIYAAGFGWKDVHEQLKFQGRTGILRANHRSTKEITEGARDYLVAGLDEDLAPDEQTFVHSGPPPVMRAISDLGAEADLVARFLRGASREFRLTIGSGAVLVPDKYVGEPIAAALADRGIPAAYRDSRRFELDDNSVTVLPLKAAKGLEFPVVAVAGFLGSTYPHLPDDGDAETMMEVLIRERRTLFVAMTRAMRALLVVTPLGHDSILYDGFDPALWNIEAP